jgi:hypothetical protein
MSSEAIIRIQKGIVALYKSGDIEGIKVLAKELRRLQGGAETQDGPVDFGQKPAFDVIGESIKNLPASASAYAGAVADMVYHPINTLTSIGKLMIGAAQKAVPDSMTGGPMEYEKYADQIGKLYADRYGSIEGFKRAWAEDPVSIVADFSLLLTGGGAAVATLPGKLGKIGGTVQKIGSAIDPLQAAAKGAAAILEPTVSAGAKLLRKEGISPTVGQIYGGRAAALEEKMTSVPGVGDVISSARKAANEDLTRAAFNRALNPIGKTAKGLKLDRSGLGKIYDSFNDAYERLIPQASFRATDGFLDDIISTLDDIAPMLDDVQNRTLQNTVSRVIIDRVSAADVLTGKPLHRATNALRKRSEKLSKGMLVAESDMGEALSRIVSVIDSHIAKQNPALAVELSAVNKGYSNYVVLRRAYKGSGVTPEGITPAKLDAAVRMEASGKNAAATGRANMQDLSSAGVDTLGSTVPNSFTADRVLMSALAAGGGGYIDPKLLALQAAASVPYAPGVRQMIAKGLLDRPQAVRDLARTLRQTPAAAGPAAYQSGRLQGLLEDEY